MSRASALVLAGAVVMGVGASMLVLQARDSTYPLPVVTERLLYLRSGGVAARLALSFDAVVADVYWIRTIQHYGRDYKHRSRSGRFENLHSLLDLTTTLDPHFLIAYRFGAIFLASRPPEGPGRTDQALALLEKGIAANPDAWQLAHDIGFTHYLYTGDYAAAADWFKRAAGMPRAPAWIGPLAASTLAGGGNRAGARQMLLELRSAEEEYIRKAAERALTQLDALDRIDVLAKIVEEFSRRHGRRPASWQEIAAVGLLTGVPVDAFGVPFAYDPATGTITIGSSSPLLPLPPTLVAK